MWVANGIVSCIALLSQTIMSDFDFLTREIFYLFFLNGEDFLRHSDNMPCEMNTKAILYFRFCLLFSWKCLIIPVNMGGQYTSRQINQLQCCITKFFYSCILSLASLNFFRALLISVSHGEIGIYLCAWGAGQYLTI